MSFSIPNHDCFVHQIDETIILRMKPCGSSLAQLYFTKPHSNEPIDPPCYIYTYDAETHVRIPYNPLKGSYRFCLCVTDIYEIVYKNEIVLTLTPQKGWNITEASSSPP